MRERRPGLPSTALLLVAALVASACAPGAYPVETLRNAPDEARERGSYRLAMEVRGSVVGDEEVPDSVTAVEGAVDLSERKGWLTVSSGLLGGAGEGASCGIRFDGSARYFEVSEGAASWVRIEGEIRASVDDPTSWIGGSGAFLEHLRGTGEDVEVVGEEEVRGVDTTHYRFRASAERAREAEGAAPGLLDAFEVDSLPSEVWVDGDGLPRRVSFTLDRDFDGTDLRVEVLAELYDFGGPVAVEVPPEGEVAEAPDPTQAALSCFGRGVDVPEAGSPEVVTQSVLLAVVSAAKDIAAQDGSYEAVTAELLRARLREFGGDRIGIEVVGDGPSTGPRSVSVFVVGSGEIRMSVLDGGRCVGVRSFLRPEAGSLGAFFGSRDLGPGETCHAGLLEAEAYTLSVEEIASGG